MLDLSFQQWIVVGVVVLGIINIMLDSLREAVGGRRAEREEANTTVVDVEDLPPREAPREAPRERPRPARAIEPEPVPAPIRRPEPPQPVPAPAPARRAVAPQQAPPPEWRGVAPPPQPARAPTARPRDGRRRARVTPAMARRGVVLMVILGPCRGMERSSE